VEAFLAKEHLGCPVRKFDHHLSIWKVPKHGILHRELGCQLAAASDGS
jgi:hypothetical protein